MKPIITGTIHSIDSISADLDQLGLKGGMNIIVHSSFKSLGHVIGGPAAVIEALERVVTDSGTILMPTFTENLCDPSTEVNFYPEAYRERVRASLPLFQPDLTPTTKSIGIIPELFRKQNGTIRSSHPHLSFAARGRNAEYLIANHSFHYALGEGSPIARLYDLQGHILFLGAPLNANTSLHLAEYRVPAEHKGNMQWSVCILQNGKRTWSHYDDVENDCSDFPNIFMDYGKAGRPALEGKVGNAHCFLIPQALLVDYAVDWMIRNRK